MNTNVTFRVKTEALKTVSETIRTELGKIRQAFSELNATVVRTEYYWSSEAADGIRKTYAGFQDRINKAAAGIEDQVIDLGTIAGIYEKAESDNEQKPASLSDDVIF